MAEKEEAEMEEDEDAVSARLDSHREILLQMEQIYELEQTNVNLILQK